MAGLAGRSLPDLMAIWSVSPQEGYASLARLGQDATALAVETDIHPPLYYFLVHFWMAITGSSEYALRFPAVFFGALTIPLLYVWGKRLAGRGAALGGCAVAMLSPFYLDFSQQVRMYTLVTFLAVVSMYSFDRAFRDGRRIHWVTYALATSLALYTHYFAVTIILVQGVIVAASLLRDRDVRRPVFWAVATGAAGLLLAPWAPFAWRQVAEYQNRSLLTPDWQTVFARTWQTFNLGVTVDPAQVAPVLGGILAVFLVGLALAWRTKASRPGLLVLLACLVLPVLAGLAIFRFKPMFHPKYFMMASPAYYLLLGASLNSLRQRLRWVTLPLAVFVVVTFGYGVHSYFSDQRFWKDDTRAVGRYLESRTQPEDLVLSDLIEPLGYYYKGPAPAYYLPGDEGSTPARLEALAGGGRRVFLVHYEHSYTDPQGLIPFLLERSSDSVTEKAFRGYSLKEYSLRPDAGFDLTAGVRGPGSALPGGLALEGVLIGGEGFSAEGRLPRVPSGGRLWVTLSWRLDGLSRADYKASLSLLDSRGRLAAQKDSPILRGIDPTSRWTAGERAKSYYVLPVFAGVPPGEYQLRLSVYAEQADPAGRPGDSRPPQGQIDLGRVVVGAPRLPVQFRAEDMGVQAPASLGLIDGLGYTLPARQFRPGETIPLTLFLKATSRITDDLRFRFELRDASGVSRWTRLEPPQYPTSQWKPGDGVREWQDLVIPGKLPAGEYRLLAGLATGSGAPAGSEWDLGLINIVERPRDFTPPAVEHSIRVPLGDKVALLGYDLDGDPRPGGGIVLTLYWQALTAVEDSYSVFAHLLDGANRVIAQHDGIPAGDSPTSGWLEGEIVKDQRTLPIPAGTAPGQYTLEVGMYDPASGRRLTVPPAPVPVVGDALWLTKFVVR